MKRRVKHAIGARPRMSTFLRTLVLLTIAFHAPFTIAMTELARRMGVAHPWVVGLLMGAGGVALFLGRARAGMPDSRRSPRTVWFVDIPYFVHWCACIFSALVSLVGALVLVVRDLMAGDPVALHGGFYLGVYALGLLIAGYGVLVRRRVFRIERVDVPIPGLPGGFDGYRIAHLSDLHIGALTPKSWGERWAQASNDEAPDAAVVTGDMVTSGTVFHEDIADVIGGLQAKDGVFVSMGNHDYFGEGEPLISLLRARGARVLRNEGEVVRRGSDTLYLAGIDDTWTHRDDLDRALGGRPEGATTVLLAHDPERFPAAAERDVSLVLSGHTHGGQVAVPFLYRWLSLSHLTHHFHVGLYRIGASTLYVHPGLGTTGPPIRFGVAPAVTILTLRTA